MDQVDVPRDLELAVEGEALVEVEVEIGEEPEEGESLVEFERVLVPALQVA